MDTQFVCITHMWAQLSWFKSMWTRFRSGLRTNTTLQLVVQYVLTIQNQYLLQWTVWFSYMAFNQFRNAGNIKNLWPDKHHPLLIWLHLNEKWPFEQWEMVIKKFVVRMRYHITYRMTWQSNRMCMKNENHVEGIVGLAMSCLHCNAHTIMAHSHDLHFIWQ